MLKLALTALTAAVFTVSACGSFDREDRDRDDDRDADSEEDDADEEGVLPIGGGGGGEDDDDDTTLPGNDGEDDGGDEALPPGGGGGGAGGGGDAPPGSACAEEGVPLGGRCELDSDGSRHLRRCVDGEPVFEVCEVVAFDPDFRCVENADGAACVPTYQVNLQVEEPMYACFPSTGQDYLVVLLDDGDAVALDDADGEHDGTWSLGAGFSMDLNLPGLSAGNLLMKDLANGVVTALENEEVFCVVVGLEAQNPIDLTLDCHQSVGGDFVFFFDSLGGVYRQCADEDCEGDLFGAYWREGDTIFAGFYDESTLSTFPTQMTLGLDDLNAIDEGYICFPHEE